ncbi:acyl transferase [Cytophagales bacterium LB-30]|uniref:Acyl transferase n=1 Tax=Shiella aurantiaca TaxID=3058365 RepID=A0ABT8F1R5_9BACT|nr:acyl transferase [Shiella aurantiaca]MDN4164372.1 acyl transferase [Shiella aurantiaca]
MKSANSLKQALFTTPSSAFTELALAVFRYQQAYNPVYKAYTEALGVRVEDVVGLESIPFLPISFFKSQTIKSGDWLEEAIFTSSGTTAQTYRSRHFVQSLNWYHQVSRYLFEQQYGAVNKYHILALLPSYLERDGSSLIEMVQHFIQESGSERSGFYLNEYDTLKDTLQQLDAGKDGRKVLLIGVTFGLLDFAEYIGHMPLQNTIIMETGGMKGRRKEITRAEVHEQLIRTFDVPTIHSEYGMTELLSQAYSAKDGMYLPAPWMRFFTREVNDPFQKAGQKAGVIQVMDLANIDSCSFIETEDMGIVHADGRFEILGRLDNSDQRGCSLMVAH